MSFTCRQPQWDANSIKWFKVMRRRFNDAFSRAQRRISFPSSPSPHQPPPVQGLQRVFAVQFGNYLAGNLTLAVEIEDVDSVKVVRDI